VRYFARLQIHRSSAGLFSLVAIAMFSGARAEAAPPEARVAALLSEDITAYREALQGFKAAYKGPVIDFDMGQADDKLGELRASHPALVLAVGVRAAKAAAEGFADLPVVYCMVLDPGVNGISGPNVTGVTLAIPVKRQIEGFKQVLPTLGRLGVVFSPAKSGNLMEEARSAAAALGVTLLTESVQRSDQVPDALARLAGKVDGLWLPPDATVVTKETFRLALELSLARKLPLMVFNSQFVKAGALLALSPDYAASGSEAARIVKLILSGKKPADIPTTAARGTLVLNVGTARNLGIEIPASVLKNSQQVE
jgi:putative ABC transport system substrate-binding protein